MSAQGQPGIRVFSVLGRSVGILARNFVPFYVLSLFAHVPNLIYVLYEEPWSSEPHASFWIVIVLSMVLAFAVTGALTYGVVQQIRGRRASIGDCLSIGLGRMLSVLGVSLVMGIVVSLGLLALLVPGIVMLCLYYVAVPVAVVERRGVFSSLARSTALTAGYRWYIFALGLVMTVVWIGVHLLMGVAPSDLGAEQSVGGVLLQEAVGAVFTALGAVTAAVVYYDLRLTKEQVDIEDLAHVFE